MKRACFVPSDGVRWSDAHGDPGEPRRSDAAPQRGRLTLYGWAGAFGSDPSTDKLRAGCKPPVNLYSK